MKRTQTPKHRRAHTMHLKTGSQQEIRAMNSIIEAGPLTIILVFRPTCPHCVTYKPIWNDLVKTKGRTANMISMESDVYQSTPMAAKKQISGVPSVLYVNSEGEITEAPTPRDKSHMSEVVRTSDPTNAMRTPTAPLRPSEPRPLSLPLSLPKVSEPLSLSPPALSEPKSVKWSQVSEQVSFQPSELVQSLPPARAISQNLFTVKPSEPKTETIATELPNAVVPGTMVSDNELSIRPASTVPSVVQQGGSHPRYWSTAQPGYTWQRGSSRKQQRQRGGDPWSALLFAAQQAAPAAALLGAYAALPVRRSSGLGPVQQTRKTRKARKTRR